MKEAARRMALGAYNTVALHVAAFSSHAQQLHGCLAGQKQQENRKLMILEVERKESEYSMKCLKKSGSRSAKG